MFIKNLTIKETKPTYKIIRDISFKLGLNFIVDAGQDQEKGNSVGKTTILKLIDIALGAKDKKYVYYDDETQKTNVDLEKYIEKNRLRVELIVVDSLDIQEQTQSYTLAVELFPRGKHYIDDNFYNTRDYLKKLNYIFFNNEVNTPSFRQLIHMFVRIDQRSDNNKFLKFLTQANEDQYENIYDYLFELQDPEVSSRILSLRNDISDKKKN